MSGSGRPSRGGGLPDAGQRRAQVALDVDGQRLERADVEHPAAPLRVLGHGRGGQPVERGQERGQGLARPGRRDDQGVLAARDRVPGALLGRRRARRRRRRTRPGWRGRTGARPSVPAGTDRTSGTGARSAGRPATAAGASPGPWPGASGWAEASRNALCRVRSAVQQRLAVRARARPADAASRPASAVISSRASSRSMSGSSPGARPSFSAAALTSITAAAADDLDGRDRRDAVDRKVEGLETVLRQRDAVARVSLRGAARDRRSRNVGGPSGSATARGLGCSGPR